jgi:hypothetical protein
MNDNFKTLLYWKLVIWKTLNGAQTVAITAFIGATAAQNWETMNPSEKWTVGLMTYLAVCKFLDGFFDQTLAQLKAGAPNGNGTTSTTEPVKPQEQQMNKVLSIILLAGIVFFGATGCSTVYNSNKITKVSSRFFGVRVTSISSSTQMPEIDLGWGSSTIEVIPTSTNGTISAPRSMSAFVLKQSINPFATGIEENSGTGDVYIGGTNDVSKAIVPSEFQWHAPQTLPLKTQ